MAFGLKHPAVYALVHGDPATSTTSLMASEGFASLLKLVERVAQAGRLEVSVPHAARLIATAGEGVTLHLIATPAKERDAKLSATMREVVVSAVPRLAASGGDRKDADSGWVAARAVALLAVLGEVPGVFSPAEQGLLASGSTAWQVQDVEQKPRENSGKLSWGNLQWTQRKLGLLPGDCRTIMLHGQKEGLLCQLQ